MARARLKQLSICECGFPLLNESILLGAEYEVFPFQRGMLNLLCGGCGEVIRDIPCVGVNSILNPSQEPRLLPAAVFDIDEGSL